MLFGLRQLEEWWKGQQQPRKQEGRRMDHADHADIEAHPEPGAREGAVRRCASIVVESVEEILRRVFQ